MEKSDIGAAIESWHMPFDIRYIFHHIFLYPATHYAMPHNTSWLASHGVHAMYIYMIALPCLRWNSLTHDPSRVPVIPARDVFFFHSHQDHRTSKLSRSSSSYLCIRKLLEVIICVLLLPACDK